MKKACIVAIGILVLLMATNLFAEQNDAKGCSDHALFPTRLAEYRIADCKVQDFGAYEFFTKKPPKNRVEGKFTFIIYRYTGPRNIEPSGLAVVRNYENALKKVGGEIVQTDPDRWVNGKIVKDGREVWAQAEKGNGLIWLRIVEKKEMQQEIVADAAAFGKDIKSTGHAAIYGITFDTNKSTIKPESAKAIGEIAKLLKADPSLKLGVVGHTDSVGNVDGNIKLSQGRADAVLQTLVRDHGIAASRLKAFGCGLFAPVTSNDTEEGRAKNRRVELVRLSN